jgi:DNA-binding NarL/FixJ family response regulator
MSIRVLVAYRQKVISEGLSALLRTQPDLELVGAADDADSTRERCDALRPDVVVLGVQAQNHDDLHLARELSESAVQTVAFTDQASRSAVLRVLDTGVRAFVCSSSSSDELLAGVRAAAGGQLYLCQSAARAMVESVRRDAPTAGQGRCHLGLREEQVLRHIACGLSSKEIARHMEISPSTVEVHRRNIMRKVGLHKVAELTRYAIRNQLVAA